MRREFLDAFPDVDGLVADYAVASEVLIHLIGPEWWERRMAGPRADPFFLHEAFANESPETKTDRFRHQHRVIGLARHMLECQWLPGFQSFVADLPTRSVLGAANEFSAVHQFLRSGHTVEFVTRTGKKHSDYDFRLGGGIAVEVKAKEDTAKYSKSSLDGKIAEARRQLPASGPGMVVLRIPDSWLTDPAFIREAEGVVQSKLRNSGRLNAIILCWEQWVPSEPPGGMGCAVRFRTFVNPEPNSPVPDPDRLILGFSHLIADTLQSPSE
jgi:hypothetical protein